MSKNLRISEGLTLPAEEAVTQTFGILAMRGAGKTYTAKVLAEEFAEHLTPVCVLDPLGVWWGLRSSADGKKPGKEFVIFGGDHADVPLEATGGEVVADFVVDIPAWVVIDLSEMRKAEMRRFATAFLSRLYHRNKWPMHLIVDEADLFAPQKPGKDETTLLGAMEDLVRRGRAKGIGTTLITQRAAVINKDVLTQVDTLFALRMSGPQDIKAIDTWVQAHGTVQERDEMMHSIASLPTGTAWVWSPHWLGVFKQVGIRKLKTFDSSATPRGAKAAVEPRVIAEVDLADVKDRMAATIEKAKESDPKELQARIRRLQAQVKELQDHPPVQYEETIIEVIPPEVVEKLRHIEHVLSENRGVVEQVASINHQVVDAARVILVKATQMEGKTPKRTTPGTFPRTKSAPKEKVRRSAPVSQRTHPRTSEGHEEVHLRAGAQRMAGILADHYPITLTKARLKTMAKLSKGGTLDTYMSDLRKGGYFVMVGNEYQATEKCIAEYGGTSESTGDIVEDYRRKLRKGAQVMFDYLVQHPDGVTREDLMEAAGLSKGGTFDTYMSDLRKFGLMERITEFYYPTDFALGRNVASR